MLGHLRCTCIPDLQSSLLRLPIAMHVSSTRRTCLIAGVYATIPSPDTQKWRLSATVIDRSEQGACAIYRLSVVSVVSFVSVFVPIRHPLRHRGRGHDRQTTGDSVDICKAVFPFSIALLVGTNPSVHPRRSVATHPPPVIPDSDSDTREVSPRPVCQIPRRMSLDPSSLTLL